MTTLLDARPHTASLPMASRREVLITGIGLVTPLGTSFAEFETALFDRCAHFSAVNSRHTASLPGARVGADLNVGLERGEALLADRSTLLALRASSLALHDAGWAPGAQALRRCGVFVGCASGPTESVNSSYAALHEHNRLPRWTLLRCLPSGAAASIAIRHGLRGPSQTYTCACASSSVAIGEAMRAIRHGYLDIALAGGTEAPFGDGTLKAWESLHMLAPLEAGAAACGSEDAPGHAADERVRASAACRPFDRSRRGIVLGEGAVFFVLEAAERVVARGAAAHARLAGFAASGDAHHWTEPCSRGQIRAMRAALADAGLAPADIGYVNAYGPGTPVGDRVEAESIASVFGAVGVQPWVSSTKASHGHLLGASGAIELAAGIVALTTGRIPPTRNLRDPDAAFGARLAGEQAATLLPGSAVLSNSFAFGGSNACLVATAA